MKSVIFVSYSMGIGGVEKALLGVTDKFIKEGWDVHLALIKPEGEFLRYLSEDIKIHKIDAFERIQPLIHNPMKKTMQDDFKKGNIYRAFIIGLCLLFSKLQHGCKKLYDYAFNDVPVFSDTIFDLAVAFAGPDAFIDTYVDKCVKAKEKWGWVHFDISKFGIDRSIIANSYKNYAKINIVSEQAKTIFDQMFPQFICKTQFTPNVVDNETIIRLSEEIIPFSESVNCLMLLTVGRISKEKGQYKALQSLKILIDRGMKNLKWWFVGSGSDLERCQDFVVLNGLSDYVVFVGAKANPYPYMKRCDMYVQPSEHEGFCITLAEAKLFGMPIVATDFTGAKEQLTNYPVYNRVVEHNAIALADAIMEVSK